MTTDITENTPTDANTGSRADKSAPAVLGFAAYRNGKPSPHSKLHRANGDGDRYGMYTFCHRPTFSSRITRAEATMPPRDDYGTPFDDALIEQLVALDLPPQRLCMTCIPQQARAAYAWEYETAHTSRTVTVSPDAAAVIAYEVAFTQNRVKAQRKPASMQPSTPITVTVSGHAEAAIAGFCALPDIGDSTLIDDPQRVWRQGIILGDSTWNELHTTFPLSLYEQRDFTTVDMDAVIAETRRVFPLSVFRTWADAAIKHNVGQDWSTLTIHCYDPAAGL